MEPITAMMLMGGLTAGLGMLGNRSAKKAAEKQRKRDMRMQMARDLVSAAGGQGLATLAPITQVPDSGTFQALQAGTSSMAPFMNLAATDSLRNKQMDAEQAFTLQRDKINNANLLQRALVYGAYPRRKVVNQDSGFIDFENEDL